jgi:N-methylhydantoinase A
MRGSRSATLRIGVDAGGTFTDFVVARGDGRLESFKLRSNPGDPAAVILAGIERAAAGIGEAEVIHGSTVATNALLERKGAATAFVTTAGFEDMVHIGRQNRRELYNLTPAPVEPLVPREACAGVRERTLFNGEVLAAPGAEEIQRLAAALRERGIASVAICFLHAYQNAANEIAVEGMLGGDFQVSRSSDVSPEFREYERASTTLLNAYVRPLMETYLSRLAAGLMGRGRSLSILQSNGGSMTTGEAGHYAVRTLLSGPAGGVVGAMEAARRSGFAKALGFDMGGTSTDVSLIEGRPRETVEGLIAGFPVRVPMLDIHTVGAGGGSIARVDEGGLLRVGPESAGADPGPACYGAGEDPTVTDAHVVLGRIGADQLAGGSLPIDPARAAAAVDRISRRLRLTRVEAAEGILRVAGANMERAIRVVSIERGYDPREFALVAFGGCGGLHACQIAGGLQMGTVIVPAHAGALSALGMLLADRIRDYAAGVLGRRAEAIESAFGGLERRARGELAGAVLDRTADIRYAGQSYELTVPWAGGLAGAAAAFHTEHGRVYGYADPERAVEVVTVRVRGRIAAPPALAGGGPGPVNARARGALARRRIHCDGEWGEVKVYARDQVPRRPMAGPALVSDYGATTLIPRGWRFHRDAVDNLVIVRSGKVKG